MKKLIMYAYVLLTIFGCKKEPIEPIIEDEDYYDCSEFFMTENEDYMTLCTINTPLVNISDSTIDGGGTVCKFIIAPLDSEIEIETGVSFVSLEKSSQAKSYYEAQKANAKEFASTDSLVFHTVINIDGFEAYISESQKSNYVKTISTRYKNVLVGTAAVYYKNWYPETPCNYETNQLIDLLSNVLKNM